MCGIAGIVGVSPAAPVVEAMIRAIAHRGPDGMMVVGGADHMFGHARLAIIDVAGGAQPKLSNSGRWLIVFNGEIYNYRELRSRLEGAYVFSSSSDTEVILAAVECLGIERALAEIDGMYAIALFDREAKVLHLARDHFGIKPLYYTWLTGGSLAFASEMKAFRCLEVPLDVDDVAVATQLLCRCIPAPATGWAGLKKLRPGEWLTFDARGGSIGNARRIVPRAAAWSQSTGAPAELHNLLVQAVARQMVADVPVGILLSGGVDSALVAQIAAKARPDLHSFCVGYSAADRETEFAAAAESARAIGTVHENIVVRATDFVDELRHAVWHLEEPIATTSLVTYSLLCRSVARERKVVLSGQGADEPWAGYSRHRAEAVLDCVGAGRVPLARAGDALRWIGVQSRLPEVLRHVGDTTLRWIAYRSLFPMWQVRQIVGNAVIDAALERIVQALAWADGQAPQAARDDFGTLLIRDTYTDLSDNLLLLSDKLAMAYGLEVRVPLLDVAYASHVLGLPRHAKRAGYLMRHGKVMHKQIAERFLPRRIVNRCKQGFETPLRKWFATDFGHDVCATIFSPQAPIATVLPVADFFPTRPSLDKVGHELQQQLFSLWTTNEWIRIFRH